MTQSGNVTNAILDRFENLNKIPRKSKHEERIAKWLSEWAESEGFPRGFDRAGNLVMHIPASPGREEDQTIILQGHMDMVCEKMPESTHDFSSDPIEHRIEGDWLMANDTTLGADNGIALAIAMEAAVSLSHPPLELLFTVDEETGLTGARNLDASLLKGRFLINLDSEDEGVITIGCAGGKDAILTFPFEPSIGSDVMKGTKLLQVMIGGLAGGHSGVDIHKQGGNANRLLARVLDDLLRNEITRQSIVGFRNLHGGSARNAIPRDASIDLFVTVEAVEAVAALAAKVGDVLREELKAGDDWPAVSVETLDSADGEDDAILSVRFLERIVGILLILPTGVQRMSSEVDGLVESSSNLALCAHTDGGIDITSSIRSSRDTRIDEISRRFEAAARLSGAAYRSENTYQAWPPNPDSVFLTRAVSVYKAEFGRKPVVEIIHAGLECGVIGGIIPGIEMISIGPTIEGAHSPNERLYIPSIEKIWKYLAALLA